MTEKLWTLKELEKKVKPKLSVATWRRMIREGKVKARRIGSGRGLLYIPDSEVQRVIKSV